MKLFQTLSLTLSVVTANQPIRSEIKAIYGTGCNTTGTIDLCGTGTTWNESMCVPNTTPQDSTPQEAYDAHLDQKLLSNDDVNDAPIDQDIIKVFGTYHVDEIFLKMELQDNCCDEGGLFGPWYLYGILITEPNTTENSYAVIYVDGGFGQLTPGIIKISGDITKNNIGFDYLTTNINYYRQKHSI